MPRKLTEAQRELAQQIELLHRHMVDQRKAARAEKAVQRAIEKAAEREARLPHHVAVALTKFSELYIKLKRAQGVMAAVADGSLWRYSAEASQAQYTLDIGTSDLAALIRQYPNLPTPELTPELVSWSAEHYRPDRRGPCPLPQL